MVSMLCLFTVGSCLSPLWDSPVRELVMGTLSVFSSPVESVSSLSPTNSLSQLGSLGNLGTLGWIKSLTQLWAPAKPVKV